MSRAVCLLSIVVISFLAFVGVVAGQDSRETVPDRLVLNYHLMHPGGPSGPGDPNPAYFLDGKYHLHYIVNHPWQKGRSFSFIHVTSTDMLHWNWETTKLQPSFTGHGLFSGTGFTTLDGRPAAIYHGQASQKNWIAIAKDNQISGWEEPFAVEPQSADGSPLPKMRIWDPDCFVIGDTYYCYFGSDDPPLLKSKDLKTWTYVGPFLKHNLPEVVLGEDISCGNFFKLGEKWMLLCISHRLGCRYYLGDWDAEHEQFVPTSHGRMNWVKPQDSLLNYRNRDFFAPESVVTPDGRRVMWSWLATMNEEIFRRTIQSLPRELSLPADGELRISPLRELDTLRESPNVLRDVIVEPAKIVGGKPIKTEKLIELPNDSCEIRIVVPRAEAERKRFGFQIRRQGHDQSTLLMLRPETKTLSLNGIEAPFSVTDLPPGEDVELRIYLDNYLIEVFANDRQAVVTAMMEHEGQPVLDAFTFEVPLRIKELTIWKLKPTNAGFMKARREANWLPDEE